MKALFTSLFLLLLYSGLSLAQSGPEFPFQVVISRNSFVENSPLRFGDLVGRDQEVELVDGWLVMLHYRGFFVEFTGIENIVINELLTEFNPLPLKHNELYTTHLLSSRQTPIYTRQMDYTLYRSFPVSNLVLMKPNDHLSLEWNRTKDENGYEIKFFDRNAKEVLSKRVSDFFYTVDASFLEKLSLPGQIEVSELQFANHARLKFQLRIYQDLPDYVIKTSSAKATSATQSLAYGYFLESSRNPKKAFEFYQLATNLSREPVFKEFFLLFCTRHNFQN